MSVKISPGWYPQPGATDGDEPIERWWDGTEWTGFTRPLQRGLGPEPPSGLPRRGRSRGFVIGVVAGACALVIGGVAVGYVVMSGDGGGSAAQPSPSASSPGNGDNGDGGNGDGQSPSLPAMPEAPDGTALDVVNGITLPLPDGWEAASPAKTGGFAYMYVDQYKCQQADMCVRGAVNTTIVTGDDAKTAATKDVVKAAEEGYGNIKSHTGLKSQKVTVAGKTGYLVRWKVDAETGSDGYVQTVVFPSSQKGAFVAIHFGFDATSSAPKVSLMDQIVDGVKTYQSTGSANPTNGV